MKPDLKPRLLTLLISDSGLNVGRGSQLKNLIVKAKKSLSYMDSPVDDPENNEASESKWRSVGKCLKAVENTSWQIGHIDRCCQLYYLCTITKFKHLALVFHHAY